MVIKFLKVFIIIISLQFVYEKDGNDTEKNKTYEYDPSIHVFYEFDEESDREYYESLTKFMEKNKLDNNSDINIDFFKKFSNDFISGGEVEKNQKILNAHNKMIDDLIKENFDNEKSTVKGSELYSILESNKVQGKFFKYLDEQNVEIVRTFKDSNKTEHYRPTKNEDYINEDL